jgi:tRNA(Ile)-lysidine synthase
MLSAENDILEQYTNVVVQQTVQWKPGNYVAISRDLYRAAPLAIQRRLLRSTVDVLLPLSSTANFAHIESLRRFVIDGAVGKRLGLPGGAVAECHIDMVLLWNSKQSYPAPSTVPIPVPGTISIPRLGTYLLTEVYDRASCSVEWVPGQAYLAMESLRFPLETRFARPGDRFYPLGAPGAKKLKDFFIDSKVPRAERAFLPLVVSGSDIVWVVGYRIAEPFKVLPDTRYVLSLQYKSNDINEGCA